MPTTREWIYYGIHLSLSFVLFLEGFFYSLNPLFVMGLLKLLISFWFNFGVLELGQGSVNLGYLHDEGALGFINSFFYFFYFINFCSNFYYFSTSNGFVFVVFLFFQILSSIIESFISAFPIFFYLGSLWGLGWM